MCYQRMVVSLSFFFSCIQLSHGCLNIIPYLVIWLELLTTEKLSIKIDSFHIINILICVDNWLSNRLIETSWSRTRCSYLIPFFEIVIQWITQMTREEKKESCEKNKIFMTWNGCLNSSEWWKGFFMCISSNFNEHFHTPLEISTQWNFGFDLNAKNGYRWSLALTISAQWNFRCS